MRFFVQSFQAAVICALAAPAFAAAPSITSFSPAIGPIGTRLTLTGTAFTGATKITIGGVAALYTVSSATSIVATLPASPTGKVSVTTAGGTATSTASFTVTPGAIAAAAVAHPGAKVVFNASGLDAYASMDVYFDTTDVALTVTNSNGIASTTVTLPSNATPACIT